jgi:hypothetical protein
MQKNKWRILMTAICLIIGVSKPFAQGVTPEPAAGDYIGHWNGIVKSCDYPRGIKCIAPNKISPSFDLVAFDNIVALGNINNIKNYIITSDLEAALGARVTKGIWISIIAGFKNGTISLVKRKDIVGYEYMVGKIIPQGKYNTLVVGDFIGHIVFYK